MLKNTYDMTLDDRKAFMKEKSQSGLPQLRVVLLVISILYGLFAILDMLLIDEFLFAFLLIRFGIVIPMALAVLVWTYHSSFLKIAQRLIVLVVVAGGAGISFMLIVHPDNFSYYGGLFLVIFTTYFLVNLDAAHAIFSGSLMLLIYIAGYIVYHGFFSVEAILVVAFYIGANIIGAFGNYQLNYIGQSNFMQKKRIERQNELLEERVREQDTELIQIEKAIDSTRDAVVIYNPQGEITYRNMAYKKMVRSTSEENDAGLDPFGDICKEVLEVLTWEGERELIVPNQKPLVLLVHADAVQDRNGLVVGVVMTCTDITARKDDEEKMRYLSYHDTLTGLFDRAGLDAELTGLDQDEHLPLSVIMADLNGLKIINDTYGHAVGDRFLQQFADILRQVCRGTDVIARWGGDEFVILLPQTSQTDAECVVDRILLSCRAPFFEGIPISVALGLACKEYEEPISIILQTAENRMYKQKLTESRSHKSAVLNALRSTLQEKSCETDTHGENMKEAAQFIGVKLGLSHDEMVRLDLLIQLHDIGKINMPAELLQKEGPLTFEEWELMRQHPEIGYRIARNTDDVSHVAEEILSHHERWDGTGYPNGLMGTDIPLLARITALADAYEIMKNGRPYKKPMTNEEIRLEIQRCSGKQFDPEISAIFLAWQQLLT